MREIKFRMWHKEQKKMYSAEELGEDQMTLMPDGRGFANISGASTKLSQIDNGRKTIPFQYTGLKDKNGKEIYERDVVRCFYETWDFRTDRREPELLDRAWINGITYVEWNDCGGWYPFVDNDDGMPYPDTELSEVIGNIYENPELLEGESKS